MKGRTEAAVAQSEQQIPSTETAESDTSKSICIKESTTSFTVRRYFPELFGRFRSQVDLRKMQQLPTIYFYLQFIFLNRKDS